ncbi:MAG: hypothetical protein QXN57_03225 [Desulfurococcaceae archaeon]
MQLELHIPRTFAEDYSFDITSPLDLSEGVECRIKVNLNPILLLVWNLFRDKLIGKELGKDVKLYYLSPSQEKKYYGVDDSVCWLKSRISRTYIVERLIAIHISTTYRLPVFEAIRSLGLTESRLADLHPELCTYIFETLFEKLSIEPFCDSRYRRNFLVPIRAISVLDFSRYLHPFSISSQFSYRLARFLVDCADFHGYRHTYYLKKMCEDYEKELKRVAESCRVEIEKIVEEGNLDVIVDRVFENNLLQIHDNRPVFSFDFHDKVKEILAEEGLDVSIETVVAAVREALASKRYVFAEGRWMRQY